MKRIFFVITLLLFACFNSISNAKTYTVGSTGCDYTSIQKVFDDNNLEPGDIIEVYEGTYHEQVVWGSEKPDLEIVLL